MRTSSDASSIEGGVVSETKKKRMRSIMSKEEFVDEIDATVDTLQENLRKHFSTTVAMRPFLVQTKRVQQLARKFAFQRLIKKQRVAKDGEPRRITGLDKVKKTSVQLEIFLRIVQHTNPSMNPAYTSRAEVTKRLCEYIKVHNLQKKDELSVIVFDSVLVDLFRVKDTKDTLQSSYPNLQKLLTNCKCFVDGEYLAT